MDPGSVTLADPDTSPLRDLSPVSPLLIDERGGLVLMSTKGRSSVFIPVDLIRGYKQHTCKHR
jgi:hypothetical protein